MSEDSLAVQKLVVATLKASAALGALLPADRIRDQQARPDLFPCVLLGEAQTVEAEAECVFASEVFTTIHVWSRDKGMVEAKAIAGAIRRALRVVDDATIDGYVISGFEFEDMRIVRDPDGKSAHGVLTFRSMVEEVEEA